MQMSKKDPEHSTRSNTIQTNKIILHMAPQNCEAYTIFTNGLNIKLETHLINMIQKHFIHVERKRNRKIVKPIKIAQEISKYILYKNCTKLKTCTYILRYCLCFHQKDKFVNWACQVRHVSESFFFGFPVVTSPLEASRIEPNCPLK